MANHQNNTLRILCAAAIASLLAALPASAGERVLQRTHVRTDDPAVNWLLTAGEAYAPAFRRALRQLEASDVVAYVRFDPRLRRPVGGEISFVGATAGIRYVQIRLLLQDEVSHAIAILGHELTHAVEIALDPTIVDPRSMASAYLATALAVRVRAGKPIVDTGDARVAGDEVMRELRTRIWALQVEFDEFRRRLPARAGAATGE